MDNSPYTRYHAQIQRVCRNIRRNIDHALDDNPPTLPPDDGSFMIKVLRYKLDRATGQSHQHPITKISCSDYSFNWISW